MEVNMNYEKPKSEFAYKPGKWLAYKLRKGEKNDSKITADNSKM